MSMNDPQFRRDMQDAYNAGWKDGLDYSPLDDVDPPELIDEVIEDIVGRSIFSVESTYTHVMGEPPPAIRRWTLWDVFLGRHRRA